MTLDEQVHWLLRGTEAVYSKDELRRKLDRAALGARQLRIKLGMDPTAPDIHLGHSVVLRKLRQFQDLGHRAVLIIGDYTALIGDPTGKSQTRPLLSARQIAANADTYFAQAGHVLDSDPDRLEIRYNSEWLGSMSFSDVLRLASRKTVARMLERDTFEKRFKSGQEIGIHELMYPLMQGWDSVCVQADIELGGTDQTFNNLVGRDLQKAEGQDPQVVLITPILVGLDGVEKMSKSLGNYIGVTEAANDMFGKLMSIPDEIMPNYYMELTDVPEGEFRAQCVGAPRAAKIRLARALVTQFHHGVDVDAVEHEFFDKMKGGLPEDIPELGIAASEVVGGQMSVLRLAVLCGFASTNGEARRLVHEGGLRLNQEKLSDPNGAVAVRSGDVLQRGKRRFVRIQLTT